MTSPDGAIHVRHASIVELDRHESSPVLAEVFRILNAHASGSPQVRTRVALVLIIRGDLPETLILDVNWLDFAIEVAVSEPAALEGVVVPAPVILGTIEGWPSRWTDVAEDLLSITDQEGNGSWRMSIR